MKFLHLGDLHLGIKFHKKSLIEDQAHVLDQIVDIVAQEQCSVIIAGDVYDTTNPSIEAQTLWFRFLDKLSMIHARTDTATYVIPGNHDSAGRLNLGSQFTELGSVHIITNPDVYYDADNKGISLAFIPFIKPQVVDALYGTEYGDDYTGAFRDVLSRTIRNAGVLASKTVIVAHQTFEGGKRSESEFKPFMSDAINANVADGYIALLAGHLHEKQTIKTEGNGLIHYSGSILPYAFGDEYFPSVTMWDFEPDKEPARTEIPITPLHNLRVIQGDLSHVLGVDAGEDYVCVKLVNCVHLDEALARLQDHFTNLLNVTTDLADKWIADLSKPIGTFKDFNEAVDEFCKFLEVPTFTGKKRELVEEAVDAFNQAEN